MPIIEQTTETVLPMGEYSAMIADVRLVDGMFGQQTEILFHLEGDEFDGAVLKAWAAAKFSPRSKLFRWVQAAFGGSEIPVNYDLNTDDLLQRRVVLRVTIKTKDDGSEYNRVDDVRPYRAVPRGRAGAAPGAAPAAAAGNGGPPAPAGPPAGPAAVPGGNGGPVAGPPAGPPAPAGWPPDDIPF